MLTAQVLASNDSRTLKTSQEGFVILQYCIAAMVFYIYGIQVCPFLEDLETTFFTRVIVILFVTQWMIRHLMMKQFIHDGTVDPTQKQFFIDFFCFFLGGLALAIGNAIAFDFPIDASFRVMFGFTFLGYFVSLQLKLKRENTLLKTGKAITFDPQKNIVPISRNINSIIFSLLMGSIVSLLMVVWKDLEWLKTVGNEVSLQQAIQWILYEFLFVGGAFAGYGIMITTYLSSNLSLSFSRQQEALTAIREGRRDVYLPAISNNEFRCLADDTNHMLARLITSEEELNKTRDASIMAISSLAETRDNETGAHIIRTSEYIRAICHYLKGHPKFSDYLTDERIHHIYKSAPLHDIGKVGIPDAILLKPGKLTDDEFDVMKQHPIIGRKAIEKAEEQSGEMPFLRYAKEISESHHEKWDGSGYPYGLKGDAIPLSGRLMALADVYDALISKRVYKPAFSHEKSKAIILEGKGKHFDPDIVDAFIAIENEFVDIANKHKDETPN